MRVTIRNGFDSYFERRPSAQVVIDVFRASSTTIALLESNVSDLVVANDLSVIKSFHEKGYHVVSEVFDLGIDNSPTLVLEGAFSNKKALLKTSNLTTAISDNYCQSKMYIGCFNNIGSLSKHILNEKFDWVEIVPAGLMARRTENPEDTECAYMLESLLVGKKYEPNWQLIQEKIDRKLNEQIRPQFYINDLHHSLKINFSSVVPLVEKVDDSSFRISKIL